MFYFYINKTFQEARVDNLTELTSQDLILRAMNETRNIERLALSIGICYRLFSGKGPKFQPIRNGKALFSRF